MKEVDAEQPKSGSGVVSSSTTPNLAFCAILAFVLRLIICIVVHQFESQGRGVGFRYTDVDLDVFQDAAASVRAGGSAFDRHTYRYTPLLAKVLSLCNHHMWARGLFVTADVAVGLAIYYLLSSSSSLSSSSAMSSSKALRTSNLWWLFNPLPINICTRGSAESLIVLMPVMATLCCLRRAHTIPNKGYLLLAGIFHGAAVHCKIYPVIYSLSYALHVVARLGSGGLSFFCSPSSLARSLWPAVCFAAASISSFAILTYCAYAMDGERYLDSGLMYHFGRVDHRHNYSIFWYLVYLAGDGAGEGWEIGAISRWFFLPQAILIVFSSAKLAPGHLHFCLFLQTFLFVAMNKVITGQYFVWYLCLLPLCAHTIDWGRNRVRAALLALGVAVVGWLGVAFLLEMRGESVHMLLFRMSTLFFAANVALFWAICTSYNKAKIKEIL